MRKAVIVVLGIYLAFLLALVAVSIARESGRPRSIAYEPATPTPVATVITVTTTSGEFVLPPGTWDIVDETGVPLKELYDPNRSSIWLVRLCAGEDRCIVEATVPMTVTTSSR